MSAGEVIDAPQLQGEGVREGEPLTFYVGDNAELAGQLVRDLNEQAGEPIASDLGVLWRTLGVLLGVLFGRKAPT